jgi:MFS family permease
LVSSPPISPFYIRYSNPNTGIITGFFYFTPIVAAILGETVGHWLHDFFARWYTSRHAGRHEPEARLAVVWLSTPFMIAGLILLGFALENGYHFMITSLGWGMYVFGIMITTVGLNAYVLDGYPEVYIVPISINHMPSHRTLCYLPSI